MNSILLRGEGNSDHTLISNVFLDEYMPAANGEYVKVYLYLLRCLESNTRELSIPVIADKFDYTENDVHRALKYWEKLKLLTLEYDTSKALTGIRLVKDYPQEEKDAPVPIPKETSVRPPLSPDTAPLSQEELKQLVFVCEQYLGKTLSSLEMSRILYFHDSLGFDAELIEYLIEYCVSTRHKSLRYIETVAVSWHKQGYTTVAQAKEQTTTYSRAYFSILKAFGISGRNPVEIEIAYMNKWMKEYGFSLELISEACSRTMAAIHQSSFEYADKILSNWQKNGVSSLSDLEALDRSHRSSSSRTEASGTKKPALPNRFHNFQERNYNFKELEKQLINN